MKVGTKVRVRKEINRRSVIVEITVNSYGTTCYWLRDGGMFSEKELEIVR